MLSGNAIAAQRGAYGGNSKIQRFKNSIIESLNP
jgi:hypothetical protein